VSLESQKAAIRRFYDEVMGQGKLEVLDELVAPSYVEHSVQPGMPANKEGLAQIVTMLRSAFPDLKFTIEDELAEGDRAVCRTTLRATHLGDFMGIPASNRKIEVTGIDIVRFGPDGKALEHWANQDDFGMMQQLGVIPTRPEDEPV